jgi:uncharacterized membrane protein YfcA
MLLLAVLTGLGFGGAFVAGLLGVGGAILMIPLLLYVPAWLGLGSLGMPAVAAMSMVQVFFAALSGAIAHGKRGSVNPGLAVTVGAPSAIGSLLGGVTSGWLSPLVLIVAFALMATLGTVLLLAAGTHADRPSAGPIEFSRVRGVGIGSGVGFLAGLVGAGGAFLLAPLLLTVGRVPMRVVIGSSLAITLWTATAGFLGKLMTGQVPLAFSAALVLGAIPGAQMGEWVGRRVRLGTLRRLLAAVTATVAARMWLEVWSHLR